MAWRDEWTEQGACVISIYTTQSKVHKGWESHKCCWAAALWAAPGRPGAFYDPTCHDVDQRIRTISTGLITRYNVERR